MGLLQTMRTWAVGDLETAALFNSQIRDPLNGIQAAWTAYTPTWTSTGTAPSVGNGTLVGFYRQIGKTIQFRIVLTFGSTTNAGTGNYIFSPPVTMLLGLHAPPPGLAELFDSSASAFVYYAVTANTTSQLALRSLSSGALLNAVAPFSPSTWGAGDIIALAGRYEAA